MNSVPKYGGSSHANATKRIARFARRPASSRATSIITATADALSGVTHDDHVVVDTNHPLAGFTLVWDVTVTEIRDATQQEIDTARADAAELEIGPSFAGSDQAH